MKIRAKMMLPAMVSLAGCTPFMETGSDIKVIKLEGYRVYTQFQTEDKTMWAGRFDNLVTISPGPVKTRDLIKRAIEIESGCRVVDRNFTYDVRTMTGFGEVDCP